MEGILALARERFYWPNMRRDVEHYIHRCCRCLKQKRPYIQPNVTTAPLQLLSIDLVHHERSLVGYEYILVMVGHFIKYAQAYPTKNIKQQTPPLIRSFHFIPRFSFPEKLQHDIGRGGGGGGGGVENRQFRRFDELVGVMHSRTTPYRTQGNGLVERMNQTLFSMLRTLSETHKTNYKFKDHVNKLIHAYNCTVHESTGYSPLFLLFGRSPRLPIDIMLNLKSESGPSSYAEYVSKWKTPM